jgi:PAS domain S-box-containing protein
MPLYYRSELFQTVARYASFTALLTDIEGQVMWCSDRWLKKYGAPEPNGSLPEWMKAIYVEKLFEFSEQKRIIFLQKDGSSEISEFWIETLKHDEEVLGYLICPGHEALVELQHWENMPLGISLIDEDLRIITCNETECELMGYTREEYINSLVTKHIQEEYINTKIRNHLKLFSGELKHFYLKEQRKRKNGHLIWVYVFSTLMSHPVTDKKLRVNFTHSLSNIDERQMEQLVLSEYMDLFIEAIPNPLFIKDREHRFIHLNKPLCELTGFSKEQLLGKLDIDFFPEHEARVFWEKDELIFNGATVVVNEEELTNAKGEKRILSTTKHRFEIEGEELKLVGVISDITENIRTRELLYEQESLIESINQNLEDAIYRSTPDRRLVYVNKAFAQMFGYRDEKEVLDLNSISLYDDPDRRNELSEQIIRDGYFRNEQVLFRRRDESTFWGIVSGTLTKGIDGKNYFNGVIRDITEIIKVQDELRHAKQQAEQLNKLKSSFLANMSHEIRTPINGILGLAEVISQMTTDQEIKHFVDLQKQSGKRLLETINSILNLSKLEAEGAQMELNPLEVIPALKENLVAHGLMAMQKGLYLHFSPSDEQMVILSDGPLFHQILNNLIGNAIKFTEQGGVMVSCNKFVSRRNEPFVEISIKDTGIGISEEFLPNIFSPFEQESTGHKRKYEGNGLGLSITKKYIELLGGQIEVSSRKNQGSTFRLFLPLIS